MCAKLSLGLLYPGYAAEDDFPRLAQALTPQPAITVVHTDLGPQGDAHTVQALHDMGASDRLAAGVAELHNATRSRPVQAVVWACTSGSFVYGWDGAHEQARQLSRASQVPASSASLAFAHALTDLGAKRVAIAATYPEEVASHFRSFLGAGGFDVVSLSTSDVMSATLAGELDDEAVVAMVRSADRPDADAVLVPDTALHTVSVLRQLEAAVQKPVLTANQVCVWEALRLAGITNARADAGRLFGRRSHRGVTSGGFEVTQQP